MPSLSLAAITDVVAGAGHAFALCSDGRVYAWGRNQNGQLGLGDDGRALIREATLVTSAADYFIAQVAAGADHSALLTANANGSRQNECNESNLSVDSTSMPKCPPPSDLCPALAQTASDVATALSLARRLAFLRTCSELVINSWRLLPTFSLSGWPPSIVSSAVRALKTGAGGGGGLSPAPSRLALAQNLPETTPRGRKHAANVMSKVEYSSFTLFF